MQRPSTAEQKPHVLVQCEQRNPVASQLGGGVPAGKGWRPKQGFSMGQYGVRGSRASSPGWRRPPCPGTIRAHDKVQGWTRTAGGRKRTLLQSFRDTRPFMSHDLISSFTGPSSELRGRPSTTRLLTRPKSSRSPTPRHSAHFDRLRACMVHVACPLRLGPTSPPQPSLAALLCEPSRRRRHELLRR